ncbi:MAG: hypothetical protein ABIO70_21535 [Pseudomonadota bacterium]
MTRVPLTVLAALLLAALATGCGRDDQDGTCHVTYLSGSSDAYATKRWFCEDYCDEAFDEGSVADCYFDAY